MFLRFRTFTFPPQEHQSHAVAAAELKTAVAPLLQSELVSEAVEPLHCVAGNVKVRNLRNILHQPPRRLRFSDHTSKLREHFEAVAGRRRAPCRAEVLERWPANHAGKVTSRRVEIFDALAEK